MVSAETVHNLLQNHNKDEDVMGKEDVEEPAVDSYEWGRVRRKSRSTSRSDLSQRRRRSISVHRE